MKTNHFSFADRCDENALYRWENEGGCVGVRNLQRRAPREDWSRPAREGKESRRFNREKKCQPNLTLTDVDRRRLGTLLSRAETAAYGGARSRFELETKVENAKAVPADYAPPMLVTMNSTVVLEDVRSGDCRTCTLVYPDDRDLIPHSVGVLGPWGQGILGRRVGDIVQLPVGAGSRRFRIESILYQPEAAGASHL